MTTPEALEAWTQGGIGADDPRSVALLESVSAAVRAFCGWHVFPERTETITVNGSGGRELQLPTMRIADVTEVVEDDEPLDDRFWSWSADGQLRKRIGCWSADFRAVEVTLTHGFESCPDVEQVILQVAARAASSPMGYTKETVGGISVSYGGTGGGVGFLADEYAALERYRVEVFYG